MTRAAFTTRQALDALTAVLTEQLERDQNFRFTRRHVFPTAWGDFQGGMWIARRLGDGAQARRMRTHSLMSEAELADFMRLAEYYGTTQNF